MAEILLDEQTVPTTPSSGTMYIYPDSTCSCPVAKTDSGKAFVMTGAGYNASTASQGAGFAAKTWVNGSDLLIPSFGLQSGARFKWELSASKTAGATHCPVYFVQVGPNRTTADGAVLTMQGSPQTAVVDIGRLNVMVTLRNSDANGVFQGTAFWDHRGTTTSSTVGVGFCNDGAGFIETTSGATDTTGKGGQYVSLSIQGGTSSAWTVTQAWATAWW